MKYEEMLKRMQPGERWARRLNSQRFAWLVLSSHELRQEVYLAGLCEWLPLAGVAEPSDIDKKMNDWAPVRRYEI